MFKQRTIREKISCTGIALHGGQSVRLEILPAPAGNGVTFVRTDMSCHPELRACVDHLADTTLATTLATGLNGSRAAVGTVEHLLAALSGLGIDNARVLVDGPELPVLDGSAIGFVRLLKRAGTEEVRQPKRFLVIRKEVRVRDGERTASIAPGSGLRIRCSLDFDHPLISPAQFRFDASQNSFERDIAPARTFGFLHDVEALRARGLALGGSLDNAVVIDGYRVLNPEGLRFPDEFARHKVLDALGDLSLFGMRVVGRVNLHRSGHSLNTQLVRAVLADRRAFEVVDAVDAAAVQARIGEANALAMLEPAENAI